MRRSRTRLSSNTGSWRCCRSRRVVLCRLRRAVGGKDAAATPAVVRHLVEVDVDLLGPEAVRADERLGHGGHRGGADLRTARRWVDHPGGLARPPKGHLVDTCAKKVIPNATLRGLTATERAPVELQF